MSKPNPRTFPRQATPLGYSKVMNGQPELLFQLQIEIGLTVLGILGSVILTPKSEVLLRGAFLIRERLSLNE